MRRDSVVIDKILELNFTRTSSDYRSLILYEKNYCHFAVFVDENALVIPTPSIKSHYARRLHAKGQGNVFSTSTSVPTMFFFFFGGGGAQFRHSGPFCKMSYVLIL